MLFFFSIQSIYLLCSLGSTQLSRGFFHYIQRSVESDAIYKSLIESMHYLIIHINIYVTTYMYN